MCMVWWLELMGLEPSKILAKSELLWITVDNLKIQPQPHRYSQIQMNTTRPKTNTEFKTRVSRGRFGFKDKLAASKSYQLQEDSTQPKGDPRAKKTDPLLRMPWLRRRTK